MGGGFSNIYNFSAGPPYTELNSFVPLNQNFSTGDTVERAARRWPDHSPPLIVGIAERETITR